MSKVSKSAPKQTDLNKLSVSELQDRFDSMYTDCADTPCKDTVQSLMHELHIHQIELEMQNRELREAQQQIEDARDRYADLYDFAPVCYITFDASGCILEINLTGAVMLDQDRAHLIGKPFRHWLSAENLNKFFNHIKYVQQGFHVAIEELQLNLGKGRTMDVRMESVAASQTISDKPTCRSVLINISDRKQAERELLDQTRQLQVITDAMPALIAYVDRDERYQFVNRFFEEWFGLPRDSIVGRTVKEVIDDDAYTQLEKFIRYAQAGKPINFELAVPYQKQGLRDINVSYIPDFSVDGRVEGYFVLSRDVTEDKQNETQRKMHLLETAHVSRINTMGEMVAEIAHELNQPLAAISIYGDTVSRMLRSGESDQQDILNALDEIKLQADRASQVISRLRAFVSKSELKIVQTDINVLVQDVLHLIGVEARWHDVTLKLDFEQLIPAIMVDKILIEQVLLNLARNAIEAMDATDKDKRILLIKISTGRHNEVEFNVEDAGPGLNVTEIEQAFEPFYTSKQTGMGLGLTICRSIIKAHHGRMWAIPNEMGGTTFTFTLPGTSQAGDF